MTEKTIAVAVSEKITKLGPSVKDAVVDALVEREKVKRSTALVQAIDQLSKLERELLKLDKPDAKFFDKAGQSEAEFYSENKKEELKKLREKITKWENAIGKALDKQEFGDVYNLIGNSKSDGNQKSGEDKAGD